MKTLDRQLTEPELDYVLYHLNMHFEINADLRSIISFDDTTSPSIFFPKNEPIVFPKKNTSDIYTVKGNSIVFQHDILKSSFYLLSGYQEYDDNDLDQWGRPKWENSIQYESQDTNTPLVNYYFRWISEAIEKYCIINSIQFKRKQLFNHPVLNLTHDIDTVRYFNPKLCAYRFAQLVGLRPADTQRGIIAKAAFRSLLHLLHIKQQKNPWWSFNEIMNVERYFGYKSTWFILPNDGGPFSADYSWNDDDIVDVFTRITNNGNELGIHGPINSQTADVYNKHLADLKAKFKTASNSHRQHFLCVNQDAMIELDKSDIEIDCSLGYSHSEGWRNGYCLPFHPFDHKNQKMLDIWEVPLAMMDVSVLNHKKLSYDDIFNVCGELLDETREYNGVFSLLWHNSTFDELYHPGILKFYEDLHLFFSQYSMESMTTNAIFTHLNNHKKD